MSVHAPILHGLCPILLLFIHAHIQGQDENSLQGRRVCTKMQGTTGGLKKKIIIFNKLFYKLVFFLMKHLDRLFIYLFQKQEEQHG